MPKLFEYIEHVYIYIYGIWEICYVFEEMDQSVTSWYSSVLFKGSEAEFWMWCTHM